MTRNKETKIMNEVSTTLSTKNYVVYRNNVGELHTPYGGYIKFGLCVGSSDLIGIKPIVIKPDDVGKTIGVFCAFEVKTEKGNLDDDQKDFINTIKRLGGITDVLRSISDAQALPDAEHPDFATKRTNGRQGMGNIKSKKKR